MKNALLLITLMFWGYSSWGQSPKLPAIVPASPDANALAKYVNYPVNYGIGLANINIPLYEIKAGDLSLPVSLSYHASGIKVNENSGWVGLGWTLNAEPSVSRSVKGQNDEDGYLINKFSSTGDLQYKIYMANGDSRGFEEEPDEFYYKLLSKSGGFYINRKPRTNNTPSFILHPYEPILIDNENIVRISNNQTGTIDKFKITDDMGVKYNFTNVETSSTNGNVPVNTCWKAASVTSAVTSDVISFQYQTGRTEHIQNTTDKVVILDSLNVDGSVVPNTWVWGLTGCNQAELPLIKDYVNGQGTIKRVSNDPATRGQLINTTCYPTNEGGSSVTQIQPVRLREITFRGGRLVFKMKNIDNHGDCLDSIKVYNDNGIVKQFKFYYSSYIANATRNRILLDSICILDKNNVVVERYKLEYQFPSLPDYLSKSVDHWGYYNGASNDYFKSLVPPTTVSSPSHYYGSPRLNYQIGNANRNSNLYYTQAFTLSKITYPTGGYANFQYQNNQYKEGNTIKNSGGLRIYKITDFDPVSGQSIERMFTYGANEDGVGFTKKAINTESYSCEQLNYYRQTFGGINTIRNRIYYSNILHDLFYSGGSPVVYNHVTEYQTSGANTLGKITYQYNYEPYTDYTSYKFPGTTIFVDKRNDWMYGQLLSKKVYSGSKSTGIFKIVSSTGYKYDYSHWDGNSIPVGKAYRRKNLSVANYQIEDENIFYTSNNIETGARILQSDTVKNYDDSSGQVVKINRYTYENDNILSPTKIETTASDGKTIITLNKYPHDITLTGNAEMARNKLISDWRVNTLLEQSQLKGNATTRTRTDYAIFNDKAQSASVVTNTGPNGGDELRIQHNDYDKYGNILSASKTDGVRVLYLWGYSRAYPIAKIENAEYSTVEAILGGELNVEAFCNRTLPTDDEVRAFLAPLFSDASLKDAFITTYTYSPLVGVTSSTDFSRITTYYEYDSFGRLKVVKDNSGNILKKYDYNYKAGL